MSHRTRNWLTAYIVTALIFAVLDVAWILLVANPLYQSQIGGLLAPKANLPGAVLFYVIFVAGMVHYGARPNHPDLSTRQRVGGAALFGFFTYATWALTGFRRAQGLYGPGGGNGHPLGRRGLQPGHLDIGQHPAPADHEARGLTSLTRVTQSMLWAHERRRNLRIPGPAVVRFDESLLRVTPRARTGPVFGADRRKPNGSVGVRA